MNAPPPEPGTEPAAPPIPVDLVFTYVDGSDPGHAERRCHMAPPSHLSRHHGERDRNVGEITFAVRSALRHMPWLRCIVVVTDAQMPPVDPHLVASGRVRIVDHRDILENEFLPTFNSGAIESALHRIPGLSEIFLFDNDDFMHFSDIPGSMFVAADAAGRISLRLLAHPAWLRLLLQRASGMTTWLLPPANPYTAAIAHACTVLRQGRIRLPWNRIIVPRHVTQVFRKATAARLEDEFGECLAASRRLRFREPGRCSYGTLMYSLEWAWHPEDRVEGLGSTAAQDLAFFDFTGFLASRRRFWRQVEQSHARLACLNNIPLSEQGRFHEVMRRKGLGEPVLAVAGTREGH
jgi:hypothetical protein